MDASTHATRRRGRLAAWAADELRPSQLARSVVAAALGSVLQVIVSISFAALVFSGQLTGGLAYGIGWFLVGDLLLVLMITLLSSYPGSLAVVQDAPVAILAPAVAAVAAGAALDGSAAMPTVVATIVVSSLATGLLLIALGAFRLGGLVRFLPYPVMGGFLAGTGWLLATGGLNLMAAQPFGPAWLAPAMLLRWLPGLLLGAALVAVVARVRSPLALPGVLLASLLLFYGVAWLAGSSFAQLSAQGWLLGPFPSGGLWRPPLAPDLLGRADWSAVAAQAGYLVPLMVVSVMALLLNAAGLELIVKRDIDLNRELIVAGLANLAGGAGGASVGYHSIGLSSLNQSLAGGKRLPGLLMALAVGSVALLGASALAYLPKLMLGGLLVFLGLDLLIEWIYRAWFKFPKLEFAVIVSIVAVIAARGFLEGIVAGTVAMIVLFVISYSRVNVVKHALSGASYHSRVTRSYQQQALLRARGDQLYILQLQGFIFFGTGARLFEQLRARMRQPGQVALRFVALDFAQVSGVDSTALLSFAKIVGLAREQGVVLVLTGLAPQLQRQVSRSGLADQPGVVQIFAQLDYGVEWCENQLVAGEQAGPAADAALREQLAFIVPAPEQIDTLLGYCTRREIAAGEYLIRQGDAPELLFFVERGQVTARLEAPGRAPVRLETMRGGRAVGELGFYLGTPRSAAVVADEPSTIYTISAHDLARLEREAPAAAYIFHRLIVHLLGERVMHLIRAVDALQQ